VKITKKLTAVSVASAALAGVGISAGVALTAAPAAARPVAHVTSHHASVAHPAAAAVAHTPTVTTHHSRAARDAARVDRSGASQAQPGQASVTNQASVTSQASGPVPAGASAFEQCVAWRESSDTPTDPDGLFGILPSTWAELGYSGTAGQAPVWLQQIAFNRLYAEYGAQPWAPSDGC
jgi:hypothetical protein